MHLSVMCPTMVVTRLAEEGWADPTSELEWTLAQLPHHREKRFLFLTDEKRIVMPPGTQLVLTPTLALPFLR